VGKKVGTPSQLKKVHETPSQLGKKLIVMLFTGGTWVTEAVKRMGGTQAQSGPEAFAPVPWHFLTRPDTSSHRQGLIVGSNS
jgi:hypothetical protein